jgi:hypothetical protein
MQVCGHLETIQDVAPDSTGCDDCLAIGDTWLHLRVCMTCGHVGCCDSSKNQHASKHAAAVDHPIAQSYEPGEDWLWCFVDRVAFVVEGVPSFVHP